MMPVAPTIPFGGLAGFRFLERTFGRQLEVLAKSADVNREVDYFLAKAGQVTTVEQLVGDRRLLSVVLGAFGLDDDIDKRAFIRKVIEEGTVESRAFANRLVDPAYRELAGFLGFGDVGGLLIFESTRLNIVDRYKTRRFERGVGEVDLDMRLALNFKREAARIAAGASSDDGAWLRLLGSKPLRQVVEAAFGLPDQFGLIDIDRQVAVAKKRADALLGSSTRQRLSDPAVLDDLVKRFLLNRQVRQGAAGAGSPGAVALTLLQSSGLGQAGRQNLFASGFL